MKRIARVILSTSFCALLGAAFAAPEASAQSVADFYKGKNVRMIIAGGSGGGYDIYGRALSRFMSEHLPGNPTFVPQNMQGAGGVLVMNYIYGVGPQDGTAIGAVQAQNPFLPLYGTSGVQYDPLKLQWLGSMSSDSNICISWHTSPVKTMEDLYRNELILGTAGASGANSSQILPAVLNNVLGTKFKIIAGYVGADIPVAMERGEVHGRCLSWSSIQAQTPHWVDGKLVNYLVQLGLEPIDDPRFKNVPMVMDLAKNQEQRDIFRLIFAPQDMARPFVVGPGVPADRLAALRKAFEDTAKDARFIKTLEDQRLEVSLMTGQRMAEIIRDVMSTPTDVVEKATAAMKFR